MASEIADQGVTLSVGDSSTHAIAQYRLRVVGGPDLGTSIDSRGPRTVIGSHESVDLALTDPTVSRFHCELIVHGEGVDIHDLGSRNGTFVNGTSVLAAEMVFGTPLYMSPEQLASSRNADHRSDIYALGCTLFELAAGRPPYEGSIREVTLAHQSAPPPSLRARVRDACPALDDLIQQMLAKDPAARPHSMRAIARALCQHPVVDDTIDLELDDCEVVGAPDGTVGFAARLRHRMVDERHQICVEDNQDRAIAKTNSNRVDQLPTTDR